MALERSKFLFLSILLITRVSAAATCYNPDGSTASGDTPCGDTGTVTCCGEGYTCLNNNVCKATAATLAEGGAWEYIRGSCTDKNWRSTSCPSFCLDRNFDNLGGSMAVGKCDDDPDGAYFCIDDNIDNVDCNNNVNVFTPKAAPATLAEPTTTEVQETTTKAAKTTAQPTTSKTTSKTSSKTSSETSSKATSKTSSTTKSGTSSSPSNSGLAETPSKAHSASEAKSTSEAESTSETESTPAIESTSDAESPSKAEPASKSDSTVGIAVGSSMGALSVISVCVLVIYLHRKRRRSQNQQAGAPFIHLDEQQLRPDGNSPGGWSHVQYYDAKKPPQYPMPEEVVGDSTPYSNNNTVHVQHVQEVPGDVVRYELPHDPRPPAY